MENIKNKISWLIERSWFFSAFLFLGLCTAGNIQSRKDFFSVLIMCLILWVLDILFIKKGTINLLSKVLNFYKSRVQDSKKVN